MPLPTLYTKGVLNSDKVDKTQLDDFYAMHFILDVINYKRNKTNQNIHDKILLLKSETGTGKSTAFIVELFRRFVGKFDKFPLEQQKLVDSFKKPLNFDFSIFDFPDDEYSTANKSQAMKVITKKRHIIYCTQPKKLTAKGKAEEVARETYNPDLSLGVNVGFSTSEFKVQFVKNDGIMFATLGSFVETIKMKTSQEIMESYEIILIDECHILSKELEVGISFIRTFLRANAGNPGCPIFIFMSATFNMQQYADFLQTDVSNSVFVKGQSGKYDTTFLKEPSDDYYRDSARLAYQIHTENYSDTPEECDILIFIPGPGDGLRVMRELEKLDDKEELLLLKLDGPTFNRGGREVEIIESLPLEEAKKLLNNTTAKRRVTVATSVAETGITIKNLKYVIDCGFNKTGGYSPAYDMNMLVTKNVVRSAVEQRFGRVGRNFYGHAFGLYTKDTYSKLPEYEYADTYSKDIAKPLLDIMYSGMDIKYMHQPFAYKKFTPFQSKCFDPNNPIVSEDNSNCKNIYVNTVVDNKGTHSVKNYQEGVPFEDNPPDMLNILPQDGFIAGRAKLLNLGLYGTYAGYVVSKLSRVDTVEAARMLLTCLSYGVSLNDAATMAIISSTKAKYKVDKFTAQRRNLPAWYNRDKIAKKVIKGYSGNISQFMDLLSCDFIEGIFIMKYMVAIIKKSKRFDKLKGKLEEVGINYDAIKIIMEERLELIASCTKFGLVNMHPDVEFGKDLMSDIARLKRVIFSGFKCHQAYQISGARYETSSGLKIFINVPAYTKPKKIVYASLFMKEDMNILPYSIEANAISSLDGWI